MVYVDNNEGARPLLDVAHLFYAQSLVEGYISHPFLPKSRECRHGAQPGAL